ncbi:MAG: PQQ-binding-like beta-propeller repeat protein, partial [Candidatus Aminicenantes bacterium]|nr:PQQ-binding-like beta-propeller repeat protein [Candidatus Aminicenantes bacterium]
MNTSVYTIQFIALTFLLASLLGVPQLAAQDWPEFRGPTAQGHSDAVDLPLTWSESENVVWKVPIPGQGWSSPVVRDGKIWLTTGVSEGDSPQAHHSLRALGLDFDSGRLLHEVEVIALEGPPSLHT